MKLESVTDSKPVAARCQTVGHLVQDRTEVDTVNSRCHGVRIGEVEYGKERGEIAVLPNIEGLLHL